MSTSIFQFLAEPLSSDVRIQIQRWSNADDVRRLAVMPDVHPAGLFCVGMVIGTQELIYPIAVGGDIGCGIAACRFTSEGSEITQRHLLAIVEAISRSIPIGRHRRADHPALPADLAQRPLSDAVLEKFKFHDGELQLGTLGTGNHFLELQIDQDQRLWAMVHTGSRGIGQAIFQFHFRHCVPAQFRLSALVAEAPEGVAYLADMQWARDYAAANRRSIMQVLSEILTDTLNVQAEPQTYMDCDHNHLAREQIGGEHLWVHRKGANAAALDQPGLIPGSMGTESFHTAGRGNAESLNSSSHGAGRTMTRSAANRQISPVQLQRAMKGIVFARQDSRGLCAEAPAAYKNIRKVMRAQRDLVRIIRCLQPVLNYKGAR